MRHKLTITVGENGEIAGSLNSKNTGLNKSNTVTKTKKITKKTIMARSTIIDSTTLGGQ
jgi:hypothetical protein